MKHISLILVIVVLFLGTAVFGAVADKKATPFSSPKVARVAIARDARELVLAIEGEYLFRDAASGKVLAKSIRLPKSKVRLLDKGIFIGLNVYPVKKIIIEPSRKATVIVNNRKFRGNIVLMRTRDNRFTAINSINIEDYIKGVLYHEVSHHWPMETLKAQAVATRTYALYSMGNSAAKEYDMTNDIYSQVYGGKESERYRTGLAVDRTVSQVLAYKGKILPAYFHSTCGGMTEDVSQLWGIDLMPLKGVPCMFCLDSPHMQWKKNFRLKDIQDALNRRSYEIGDIKEISVESRNKSGRIDKLKFIDRKGNELLVKGKDFRDVMGPNVIKSNNYEIVLQGYYVDIIGKGWGHGVGMCQWGARGMAAQQFTYKQILSYYYPAADLVDYHELEQRPASAKPKVKSEP